MNFTGLKRYTVKLENNYEEWQNIAKLYINELKVAAGNLIHEIEHIGSTAVKGLPAKPIIDIAIAVESLDVIPDLINKFTVINYIYRGDSGNKGGHLFVKESEHGIRTSHVHIVLKKDTQWINFLKFRNILCSDTEIKNQYKELKEALSLKFKDDRRSYTTAKNNFICDILKS